MFKFIFHCYIFASNASNVTYRQIIGGLLLCCMKSRILYETGLDSTELHERNEAQGESSSMQTDCEEFELTWMVTECFATYNNIPPATLPSIDEDETDDALEDDHLSNEDLTMVIEESNIPLYEGSQTKLLVAVLLLFNCFTIFGVSNACADKILNVITKLLPKDNKMPKSHWEGKKFLRNLGLSYKSIHACRNGCCLF